MDRRDRNPLGAGLFPVHVDPVFGHVFHAVWTNLDQPWVLHGHTQELVAGRHKGLVAQAPKVQELKVKPRCVCQFDDRGRWKGENHGLPYL